METPGRVSDLMPKSLAPEGWMTELWAAAASTWRVTSCSISSARGAGPGRDGARDPDGNHRVLELGHVAVAEDAPGDDRDEQHPRDVPVLDEEPGGVVGRLFLLEQFPLAILGLAHAPSYWMGRTVSPSRTMVAPVTMTRDPGSRPELTITELPTTWPSSTGWSFATSFFPSLVTTKTA